jgi:CRISPR type IV-associated protein Csf3
MINLRIEATLQSPIVLYDPIFLDSILTLAVHISQGRYESPINFEDIIYVDIPLEKCRDVWCASAGMFVSRESKEVWHKKFASEYEEMIDFAGNKEAIVTGNGPYRSYAMPLIVSSTPRVIWFARGDKVEVEKLLTYITALGKKRAIGYGQIAKWVVTEIENDRSITMPGGVSRHIPTDYGDYPNNKRSVSYKPPYWDRRYFVECYLPRWRFQSAEEFEAYTGEPAELARHCGA